MRGSAFLASLPAGGDLRSITEREAAVVEAVRSGVALPITWCPLRCEMPGHRGVVYVAADTLRFGEPGPNLDPNDWDWVRIAVTATTAQRIADVLGVLLPTDRIADLAHAQAEVRLTPHVQNPVTATTDAMLRHHAAIEAERAGRTGLLSTIGKDWILGRELFPAIPGGRPVHPLGWDGAINYGWHTHGPATPSGPYVGQPGVILWQTKGFRHNRRHVDYSQWISRFVHPRMDVDGEWIATADVLRSNDLSRLLTYDGPLPDVRYPKGPHARDASAHDDETGALDGAGPGAALAMLERQINTRFPYRGKGPLDGIGADQVLRITSDPSRNGRFPSGPNLAALRAAVVADRRALSTDYLADAARTRYLAIAVKPATAFSQDPSAWDLSRLDVAPRDTDAGSPEASQAWDGAKSGAAIGNTVGTALEAVPAVGPALHAISVGIGAIGGAIAGAFKDTFHPTPEMARAWLALFHIYPPMIFSGVDTITESTGDSSHPAEEHAARLVRYFLLVSGLVRNTGELYNPNDIRNDNPYMARADRRYPLTNQQHLRNILHEMKAGRHVPSEIRTRAQARTILRLLRATLGPSGVMGWSEAQAHVAELRNAVRHVRAIAGERGRDAALARLLGGDVTPHGR